MDEKGRLIVTFLVIGVIVGFAAYYLLSYLLSTYLYTGYPAIGAVSEISYILGVGIASAAFSIILLMYPVYKYGDRRSDGDDYR